MVYVLLFELFRWYGFHSFSSNVSPFLPLDGTGTNLTLFIIGSCLISLTKHSLNVHTFFIIGSCLILAMNFEDYFS